MADAKDGKDDSPNRRFCLSIEEQQEATADCGDNPAAPDGPSVAADPCRDQGDDNAAREKEAGDRKDVQARLCWCSESDGGEVERDVVERAKELSVECLSAEMARSEQGCWRETHTMKP